MRTIAALLAFAALIVPPAVASAAEPVKLATVTEPWKGGPAREQGADYCVQEARFSSGHLLIVGRTKAGEVNLALGIPGGALPVGERWGVTVTADGAPPRERQAVAASKGMLVIGMGFDAEFYDRLKRGRTLNLKSAADDIGFQLSGTVKALGELEKCVAGLPAAKPGGKVASGTPGGVGAPPFPETLTAILGAAGLREVQTLAFPDVPPEQRPADYAWRAGRVLGGVRERLVPADAKFEEISVKFAQALRDRCKGAGTVSNGDIERLPGVALRTAAVDCEGEGGKGAVHVALVSYLSDAHMFAVFFHEALPAHKADADDIRDRLAEVFRRVARQEDAPQRSAPRPVPPAPAASAPVAPAPVAPAPVAEPPPLAAKTEPVPVPAPAPAEIQSPAETPAAPPPAPAPAAGVVPMPPRKPIAPAGPPGGPAAAKTAPPAPAAKQPVTKQAPPAAKQPHAVAPAKPAAQPAPGAKQPQPAAPVKPPLAPAKQPATAVKPVPATPATPTAPTAESP